MRFELPKLPYRPNALQPHISARTMEIHYEKHHGGYLGKLEEALDGTDTAGHDLKDLLETEDDDIYNLAAQVWNHNFYWESMAPEGGGEATGALAGAIKRDFGSPVEACRDFASVAASQFGSGWAWLVVDDTGKLCCLSTSDAENPLRRNATPLLTLDVWEHAYYLDYQNERGEYINSFLEHLINWRFAEKNFEQALAPVVKKSSRVNLATT